MRGAQKNGAEMHEAATSVRSGRGLHGPKPAVVVDLSGAWATSADECSNVFVKKGRAKHALLDQNGGGFIVEFDRLRGNLPAARSN